MTNGDRPGAAMSEPQVQQPDTAIGVAGSDSDSDDDDMIMRAKPKTKRHALISDDEEEDDDGDDGDLTGPAASDSIRESTQDNSDAQSIDGDNVDVTQPSQNSSRIDSDSDGETVTPTVSQENRHAVRATFNSDIFDAEDDSDIETTPTPNNVEATRSRTDFSTEAEGTTAASSGESSSDNESDEEGADGARPAQMSETLRKRLAQGAGKKAKPARSRSSKVRSSAPAEPDIHSESQRLVRESEVRLPYKEPANLGLSAILQRAKEKQEQLQSLKASKMTCKWKEKDFIPKLKPLKDMCAVGPDKPVETRSILQDTASTSAIPDTMGNDSSDEDYLPDLPDLCTRIVNSHQTPGAGGTEEGERSVDVCGSTGNDDHATSVEMCDEAGGSVSVSNSRDDGVRSIAVASDFTSGDSIAVTNSAQVTADNNADGASNSSSAVDSMHTCDIVEGDCGSVADSVDKQLEEVAEKLKVLRTPENSPKNVMKKTKLTPKMLALKMSTEVPRLTMPENDVVNLDSDSDIEFEPEVKHPGVESLLSRLLQQKKQEREKKLVRQSARQVKMSTISKTDEGEKEKYHQETFTVTVNGDMAGSHGSNISKLKQQLQDQMAKKRDESRQKRSEAMQLDDEEGFEEEEEEEMTDEDGESEEESEGEEEEEADDEQSEEEDEEEYTVEERRKRESNPFMDDEAEAETDEEFLHLELETQSLPGDVDERSNTVSSMNSNLKAALEKTKTLDLFDDEAMSESPSGSQDTQKLEISDRPFLQLSQETKSSNLLDTSLSNSSKKTDDLLDSTLSKSDMSTSRLSPGSKEKESSISSADISLMGTMIPCAQRPRPQPLNDSKSTSVTTSNHLSMPIEDSQDLLLMDMGTPLHSQANSTPKQSFSQSYGYSLDESDSGASQMLDADGFLKLTSSRRQPIRRQLQLHASQPEEADFDEALGLCSGKFPDSPSSTASSVRRFAGVSQLTTDSTDSAQDGLLMGKFSPSLAGDNDSILAGGGSGQGMSSDSRGASSLVLANGMEAGDGNSMSCVSRQDSETLDLFPLSQMHNRQPGNTQTQKTITSFAKSLSSQRDSSMKKKSSQKQRRIRQQLLSDDEENGSDKEDVDDVDDGDGGDSIFVSAAPMSDEEEDNDDDKKSDDDGDDDDLNGSDDEEVALVQEIRGGKTNKAKKVKADFFEDEAELSGSEAGDSDENYDLDEADDQLEYQSGDEDDVGTEQQLRDQVGRVHYKSVADEEARQIRLMQEMLLPDGDLTGEGRTRKFRWQNVEEDEGDRMMNQSDMHDPEVEEQEEREAQWRQEKSERENFLKELEEKDPNALKAGNEEDSQVFKMAATASQNSQCEFAVKDKENVKSPASLFKKPSKRGAFLSRSKASFSKTAEICKTLVSSNVSLPKQSKNLTYAVKDAEHDEDDVSGNVPTPTFTANTSKPRGVRRSISAKSSPQLAKKPKYEKSASLPKDSVFNYL